MVSGRSGTPVASYLMNKSDLLIVIGASFSNHTGITPKKPIIQIDFDPLSIAKFHKIDVAVYGEKKNSKGYKKTEDKGLALLPFLKH
jgi:pyruvate oxidase